MKSSLILLAGFVLIIFKTSAQSAGDYRSIGNGKWNDATKWETYNGSNWVNATTYPGQSPSTGAVTIIDGTQIMISASVPNPIASLEIPGWWEEVWSDDYSYYFYYFHYGSLSFSAESEISLKVSGNVSISGNLGVDNQNGSKSHSLSIGGSLWTEGAGPSFVNGDDKLAVIFKTTIPNSTIGGSVVYFQDITFNGIGIRVESVIRIQGTVTFINGVCYGGDVYFADGATATGASIASFVDGKVYKRGDDAFTFPIGNQGVYSPLTISAPVGQEEIFEARYERTDIMSPFPIRDPGLYSLSNCERWLFGYDYDKTTSYPLAITVGWTPASTCGSGAYITDASNVTLAHFNNNSSSNAYLTWDNHGGTGTGAAANGFVTWSGAASSGYYTLGNINTSCVTPNGITTSNVSQNSVTVTWPAVPGSASYDVYYRAPYGSWVNAATATTATSVNLSNLYPSTLYECKIRANCNPTSSAYRQTQFTTLSCGTPTGLTTTNISSGSAALNWAPVPFATLYNVEYKQSSSSSWMPANTTNITTNSFNLVGLSSSTTYDWRVYAICSYTPGGNYAQSSFTTLSCNQAYEPNNTTAQAKSIVPGTIISEGISSAADVDWFKFTMTGDANISLHVALTNLPADYDLYVYKNLTLVGSSTATGISNEVVDYKLKSRSPTTFYVKVVGKNGAYNMLQCYNLLVQTIYAAAQPLARATNPAAEIIDNPSNPLLYPNPASEFVGLRFRSAVEGSSDVQIWNAVGQLVKQYPVKIIKGLNDVQIPLYNMRPGMYVLKINKDGLRIMRKFAIAQQ